MNLFRFLLTILVLWVRMRVRLCTVYTYFHYYTQVLPQVKVLMNFWFQHYQPAWAYRWTDLFPHIKTHPSKQAVKLYTRPSCHTADYVCDSYFCSHHYIPTRGVVQVKWWPIILTFTAWINPDISLSLSLAVFSHGKISNVASESEKVCMRDGDFQRCADDQIFSYRNRICFILFPTFC